MGWRGHYVWVEDKPYGQWEPFSKGLDAHWVLWACFWAVTTTGLWDSVERPLARELIGLNSTNSIFGHLSSCLWHKDFNSLSQMYTPWHFPWEWLWYSKIHFTEYDQWKCQSRQLRRQDTPKTGWEFWQNPWESIWQNSRKQRLQQSTECWIKKKATWKWWKSFVEFLICPGPTSFPSLAVVFTRAASCVGFRFPVQETGADLTKNCLFSVATSLGQSKGLTQTLVFVSSNLELRVESSRHVSKTL